MRRKNRYNYTPPQKKTKKEREKDSKPEENRKGAGTGRKEGNTAWQTLDLKVANFGLESGKLCPKSGKLLQCRGKLLANFEGIFAHFGAIFPFFPVKKSLHIGFARGRRALAKWQSGKLLKKWVAKSVAKGVVAGPAAYEKAGAVGAAPAAGGWVWGLRVRRWRRR